MKKKRLMLTAVVAAIAMGATACTTQTADDADTMGNTMRCAYAGAGATRRTGRASLAPTLRLRRRGSYPRVRGREAQLHLRHR